MILLFSVDENWAIGYKGDILLKISEDLKGFKKFTTNNIVIMGRKTFESLPGSKALKNRINIVVTRDNEYLPQNTIVVHSIEELIKKLEEINPNKKAEEYLIGGGELAEQTLKYCHKAYITKIFKNFKKAYAYLHNLDNDMEWVIESKSDIHYQEDVAYQYVNYKRVDKSFL